MFLCDECTIVIIKASDESMQQAVEYWNPNQHHVTVLPWSKPKKMHFVGKSGRQKEPTGIADGKSYCGSKIVLVVFNKESWALH